jgi:uncharacterized protein (DUF488 family)
MSAMKLFTIGFTKKTAEEFFTRLIQAKVRCVLDIRLNNSSQLSGFAKQKDLEYFLKELAGIHYSHLPQLCPTNEILDAYKKRKITWQEYETRFVDLLTQRHVQDKVRMELLDHGCLLCSEDKPDNCHRRLVGQYLSQKLGSLEIVHL